MSDAVARALEGGDPVVALESTIITHGMPHPRNLETALAVEAEIVSRGAVPATIAILEGKIHVGLERHELEALAVAKNVLKLSRADLAYAVASGKNGSTTVAATMMAAEMAGISVFATGGIGGVHQGAEDSFDISADLSEFARTNVIVVCAGPKAILDLPKTMEVLETNGVPVVGYQTDTLPAFWSRNSSMDVPIRLDSALEIARHSITRQQLGINGGTLIANPVPQEFEIPGSVINSIIERALKDADQLGVSGKDVTPYLLSRMLELSDGKSLETNIELVLNNARLASDIAVEMGKLGSA
ncbi:MAG: pseudouridine-5-phosphate glycosidase [Rhizobiaceae bacterium]|nr:pseudouridine-5-phosphate glycosidase [Rhizobiaceae bacterium]